MLEPGGPERERAARERGMNSSRHGRGRTTLLGAATKTGLIAAALLSAATLASGASGSDSVRATSAPADVPPIVAFCSIEPQRFIVERVGGPLVTAKVLVGPGQSPHTFEPTPLQMTSLAEADVYFAIGLPFERTVLDGIRELNAGIRVVDTAEKVPRRSVEQSHHHHGEDGEHDVGLPDPHVWLNPRFAALLARSVCDALKELDGTHAMELERNLAALVDELEELNLELVETLAPLRGESVFVFHPAFGYFTDAYGLRQVPVESGGMEPGARELVRLIEKATAEGVRVIFVQPQFSSKSAAAIAAEVGGAVVPIDPLHGDYVENLRRIGREVQTALERDLPE